MAKLIPLIGVAIATLVLGGGAGWFFGMASAPKTVIVAEEKPLIVDYAIKDRIVNLADQGGRRYLKVSMVLQVAEKKGTAHASELGPNGGEIVFTTASGGTPKEPVLPNASQVHDAITSVLSSKRFEDISSFDGKERLREELKTRLNTCCMPANMQVVKILFTDFIAQ